MEEFLDAASSSLPTLRGIKYTSPELFEFGRCVTTQGSKYQVIYGADEVSLNQLLPRATMKPPIKLKEDKPLKDIIIIYTHNLQKRTTSNKIHYSCV